MTRHMLAWLIGALAFAAHTSAFALIEGGTGNQTLADPGWPKGAVAIFNHPGRVAWWTGPPFGGGQWHADCRGDVKALNAVLKDFGQLDVKMKRIVVHDGAGHSFWLAPNREPEKLKAAEVDWVFMVWVPLVWEQLRKLPAELNPTGVGETSPPSQIDVFTKNLRWSDVVVPPGIEIVDERLEAHGFAVTDGRVLEGKVTDIVTNQPLAATVRLQRMDRQVPGGDPYPVVASAKTDASGRWFIKHAPTDRIRVVVDAEGFAPRVAGYSQRDTQPGWSRNNTGLVRALPVSGHVLDDNGKPLADAEVTVASLQSADAGRYESPEPLTKRTGIDGKFVIAGVPIGRGTLRAFKTDYCQPSARTEVTATERQVTIKLVRAAKVIVTVDFGVKARVGDFLVEIEPEGGNRIGSYGGSGNINAKQQITFDYVPPGRYVLSGQPNPGSVNERTQKVMVELKGGDKPEITLKAK